MQTDESRGNCKVIVEVSDRFKGVKITPKGFWTDVIGISQHSDYDGGWDDISLSRSSGGSDGSLNPIEEIDNVIEGLQIVKEYITKWEATNKTESND
jgi:hypothetical protein